MGKRGPKPKPFERRYKKQMNGCWQWFGDTVGRGYGTFCYNGKTIRAHRHSYEKHIGSIPDGMMVLHHCDNPGCVNPDHLYIGDHTQNMRDAMRRNRLHSPIKDYIEKSGGSGVTPQAVSRRVGRLGWSLKDAVETPLLPTGVGRGQRQRR